MLIIKYKNDVISLNPQAKQRRVKSNINRSSDLPSVVLSPINRVILY